MTFENGPYTYRGSAFTATATATGVGGLSQSVSVVYSGDCTNVTSTNGCTASASFAGDSNHYGSSAGPVPITITKATQSITWNAPTTMTYGAPLSSTQLNASVSGVTGGSAPGTLSYSPAAGTVLLAGSNTLTVNAAATTNYNPATKTVTILAQYLATGLCDGDAGHQVLQPINIDGSSVFKIGSTVPTKFRICDANGVSVGTSGVVTGYGLVAAADSPAITVTEDTYSTTPDTAFRWDSTGQQWIFNQSTKNNGTLNKTGTIYYFAIHLNDGSWIYFQYGLK